MGVKTGRKFRGQGFRTGNRKARSGTKMKDRSKYRPHKGGSKKVKTGMNLKANQMEVQFRLRDQRLRL